MLFCFVRGESSEFIITKLANIGSSQARFEKDGLIAHPDVLIDNNTAIKNNSSSDCLIVELIDTFELFLIVDDQV